MNLPDLEIGRGPRHTTLGDVAAGVHVADRRSDHLDTPPSHHPHTPRQHAMHDPLTGLPNRIMLKHALLAATAPTAVRHPVGLCQLDIDGFTAINHTLGHD